MALGEDDALHAKCHTHRLHVSRLLGVVIHPPPIKFARGKKKQMKLKKKKPMEKRKKKEKKKEKGGGCCVCEKEN